MGHIPTASPPVQQVIALHVSDPKVLLRKLNENTLADIESKFAQIDRFLGPGDTFRFTCDRSGKCCRDRFENPILLSPYDVHRLRNNLKIPSRQFAAKFGCKIFGSESQLPIMLLDFEQQGKNHNKCPFLMSYGCKVYEDRPLVCRLYPVGRVVDTDMNSFFFLTKVAEYCKLGTGKEHTIEEWLEEAEVEPYFQWNDRFNSLYMEMDHKKYKALELPYKAAFGDILYHPDVVAQRLPDR
jgi:Fe-S-cluster containining protein